MTAATEMERALREILFARKPGATPKLVDGALIERIERIARAAIERFGNGTTDSSNPFDLADQSFPDKYWLFGKGRTRPDEPLYGFRVFEPGDAETPIAEGEHDDPAECVKIARAAISKAVAS